MDTPTLGSLNKEETIHVDSIISKYTDLFQLPDKPLGYTDITTHKIVTTDDRSINTKQISPLFIKTKLINKWKI